MKLASAIARWFRPNVSEGERRLLVRCRGDQALADRLISREILRRPALTRAAAADEAWDRWSRER